MAETHEAPKEKKPERVFLHTLSGRVALLSLFSACAVAGIAAGAALDLRRAVMADADAAGGRLAAVSETVQRGFVDDAAEALSRASTLRPQPSSDCDAAMAAVLASDKKVLTIGLASPSGTVLCGAPAGQKTFSDKSLKRAITSGSFAMGDYAFDEGADRPTLAFARPADGATAFVVIDVRSLPDERLKDVFPADTAYGVVDGRGVMLVRHPEPDR